jgi:hypothetical protein
LDQHVDPVLGDLLDDGFRRSSGAIDESHGIARFQSQDTAGVMRLIADDDQGTCS